MTTRRTSVVVLHNAPVLPDEHPDAASEHDVVAVAESVASLLREDGFLAWPAAVGRSPATMLKVLTNKGPSGRKPEVVFNLIEGFGGRSAGAAYATGLIELAGLPYTGSPVEALALCQEKSRTKALLRGFGLPTAPFALVCEGETILDWPWDGPILVKPDAEDASLGIDQESVVSDLESLQRKIGRIHETYHGAALLEAYLPGREFNVGVLALPYPESLPIAEVQFQSQEGIWPILTYNAKWATGSREDRASPIVCPASLEPESAQRLARLALDAYRITGCRDYARIDLRLDRRGDPMILEVNPNPDIGQGAGWARALRASGRNYAATLGSFVQQAINRHRQILPG